MLYLKRKHFSHRIQFHTEKVWFIWKKIEKITFLFFFGQNFCWPDVFNRKFFKFMQRHLNVLKLKVTKGELDISIRLEMADDYRLGGPRGAPPPASFRVKEKVKFYQYNLRSRSRSGREAEAFFKIWGGSGSRKEAKTLRFHITAFYTFWHHAGYASISFIPSSEGCMVAIFSCILERTSSRIAWFSHWTGQYSITDLVD